MSSYILKNDVALLEVDEKAAEMHHFQSSKDGLEYLWQGDAQYWAGRNPILFPVVGKSWSGSLNIKGKDYKMGNHGFARHSQFQLLEKTDSRLVLELRDNEETLAQYPYHFSLQVKYELEGKKVYIHYQIENLNEEEMPFHFGLHPAFNCPLKEGEQQKDYYLELSEEGRIELDPEALQKTIILNQPKSTWTKLSNGIHGIKVEHEGYPWLAFWSPKAPFVCIEPWFSHTDFEENNLSFEKREGCITLDKEEKWCCSYSIEIL